MPKPKATKQKEAGILKGWKQISSFLGEPVSVVERWASEGMPVTKEGRFVTATRDALNSWLGRVSGKPVHVASKGTDLVTELKEGLSYARGRSPSDRRGETR